MALTPTIQTPQAGVKVVTANPLATSIHLTNATALVVANFPTPELEVSQAGATVVATGSSNHMDISQAGVLVVARGRTSSPKLRAWTYTLDGHDFYVLRLGEDKTLVYDLASQQWTWFSSESYDFWRPLIGMNWYSAGAVPNSYGSNVVVGDDTYGHLWVLDPEQGYDDNAANTSGDPVRFERIATGQLITRERNFVPIYQVYLTGGAGYPVTDGDTVEHSYSDDGGVTYIPAGSIAINDGATTPDVAWRSLGLAVPAGRIFRITDDGAYARIDSLDVEHGGSDDG